jgi:hypothetical protein
LGFLRLCGGQCVGADDGCAEQRKSVAQGISRYVVKRYRTKTKAQAYLYLSDRSSI